MTRLSPNSVLAVPIDCKSGAQSDERILLTSAIRVSPPIPKFRDEYFIKKKFPDDPAFSDF